MRAALGRTASLPLTTGYADVTNGPGRAGGKGATRPSSATPKANSGANTDADALQQKLNFRQRERDFQAKLYDLYMDIETRFLAKECAQVDLAEALAIYSKNQFLREFIRIIC